jgi:hypothetical protein
MQSNLIRLGDMFETAERCIIANPINPPILRATTAQAQLTASISALRLAAESQLTGGGNSASGVSARKVIASDLRKTLKQLVSVARSLEPEYPGISEEFRMPRSRTNAVLIASINSMIAAVADYQAAFTDSGITPAYLTIVSARVADFQEATGKKQDGGNTQVHSTAALRQIARDGLRAARTLDACMRVHYRDNPAVLAEWTHARHIERAPRHADDATPPPGDGSGSGDPGSGTVATLGTPSPSSATPSSSETATA